MEPRDREQPMFNIVGETVALGPLSRDHLPAFLRWLNDFDVLRTTNQVRPMTMEALEDSFRESGNCCTAEPARDLYE